MLKEKTKLILEFSEGGPDNTLDLDKSRQYVIPRIVNIFRTYNQDGTEN